MKTLSLFKRNLILQWRDYWSLLITISLGPFFVIIYWMISVGFPSYYNVLIVNLDKGKYGDLFIQNSSSDERTKETVHIQKIESVEQGKSILKKRDADVLLVIPENFSSEIETAISKLDTRPEVFFYGEESNTRYLVGVITSFSIVDSFIKLQTKAKDPWTMKEFFIDEEKVKRTDFELSIPGIFILSIIMLLFSAGMIIVRDIEDHTMNRLKLTKMNIYDYAIAITLTQVLVGAVSVLLTLGLAEVLGFRMVGSFSSILIVFCITFIGIIGIAFIIVSFCRNSSVFVIVGQFPLFILIFFTGAMIPIPRNPIFYVLDHGVCWNDFLPATLAVTSLNRIFNDGLSISEILTPVILLALISLFYFLIGITLFKKRHLDLGN